MALALPADDAPFSTEHFERWAFELELDNGEPWRVEDYFLEMLEDYFSGIPENWWLVPEGNAKTTNTAGLGLYCLEFRPWPAVLWAASSRDQAEIGYRQAEGFVLRSTRLKRIFKPQEGYRRIKRLSDNARMQIFAADDRTGDGVIPTDAFIDELHRHRNLQLYRTWRGKLEKRGGQLATISTAGEPGGEFEVAREQIRQETPVVMRRPGYIHCRSTKIALHEYAVPEDADVEDIPTVKLANPFGNITEPMLVEKLASPTMTLQHWTRFVCNRPTRGVDAAITEAEWATARVEDQIPAGVPVWLGLDVAWKWDTTAAVPLWWRDYDYRLLGPASILTPPRDGTSLDPDAVEKALLDIHQRNPIHTVVMDMSLAEQLARWLEKEMGATVVDRGTSNVAAVQDYEKFMEALRLGQLKHTGDPGLTRHALNAIIKTLPLGDARFERPSQVRRSEAQDQRVIDALSAAAMAHAIAAIEADTPPEPKRLSAFTV